MNHTSVSPAWSWLVYLCLYLCAHSYRLLGVKKPSFWKPYFTRICTQSLKPLWQPFEVRRVRLILQIWKVRLREALLGRVRARIWAPSGLTAHSLALLTGRETDCLSEMLLAGRGTSLAQSVEHVTSDLGVVRSSPTLGVKLTVKKS